VGQGYKGKLIPRVQGTDISDCLRLVYEGKATAALYDEPVVIVNIYGTCDIYGTFDIYGTYDI